MRGSVHKKGDVWEYIVDTGIDPTTGKRRQSRKRTDADGRPLRTKKAAEAAMHEALASVHAGKFVQPARGTVREYLMERWLPGVRSQLRPSTVLGYEKAVKRIVADLGHLKLATLDVATVEAFYGRLHTAGGRKGRPVSAKTVANVAGVLSVALGDAVRHRLLPHNVASDAKLPRREHREMTAWTEDEAVAFLGAVVGERLAPMWRLVLMAGLRRGELCGLRWKDVNLAAGTVTVATTRVVADTVVEGEPKTRAGHRVVSLDRATLDGLKAWRKLHAEERLAAGGAWVDHGLVLVDELGRPPHPETVSRWWREAIDRAGVRPIRLHDARHTSATVLLRAGVPVKVVSQRLGHADVAVTMRVYQHTTAQDDQAAAEALARALGGAR